MALPEAIRKKIQAAQTKLTSSGVKWLTLEPGKPVNIHVINGEYGTDGLWYVKQGIHYLGEGKNQIRITCPRITLDRDCPICEATRSLKDEITAKKLDLETGRKTMSAAEASALEEEIAQMEELADSFYVSVRYVFNVLVKGESTIRLFNCPKTIFEEIFNTWAKNSEQIDMFDPYNSFYFTVQREGTTQKDTRYTVTPNMVAVPLAATREAVDKLVASRHDLNQEIKVPSYEEVKTLFDKYVNGEDVNSTPQRERGNANPPSQSANSSQSANTSQPTTPPVQSTPNVSGAPANPPASASSPAARLRAKLEAAKGA